MLLAKFDHDMKPGPTIPPITGAVHTAATLETVTFDRLPRIAFRLVRGPGLFSLGHPLWRKPVLRVCAAQRLMERR